MIYINKTVKIEAIQLTPQTIRAVYEFIYEKVETQSGVAQDKWLDYEDIIKRDGMMIKTLEGQYIASMGDFIIKGVHGEFYPCKPDIFKKTYYTQQEYAELK